MGLSNKSLSPTNPPYVFLLMSLLTFLYPRSVGIALGWEAQDLYNQFSDISLKNRCFSVSQLILVLDTFLRALPKYFKLTYFYTSWSNVTFCLKLMALILWLTGDPTGKICWLILIWTYKKSQGKDFGKNHLFNLFSAVGLQNGPKCSLRPGMHTFCIVPLCPTCVRAGLGTNRI